MNPWENYIKIRQDVDQAALLSGRKPADISIIAVSKTIPAPVIQAAIDSGIILIGENRIQEARSKLPQLTGTFIPHMVGHLQSNKARDAVQMFDCIHSIDKLSTAQAVNREAEKINKKQKVLIEIKTSAEETKSGIVPEEAEALAGEILHLPGLELTGLMTVAPLTEDEEEIRQSFRRTKNVLEEINKNLKIQLTDLSMGMSSDYRIAIEEGATMLRIGRAIFGERIP